jgi:hypothetical protein
MSSESDAAAVGLGRLQQVALRDVWPHEALDFTPWLLANAEVLGDALDLELEIEAAEHPVGGFSLDLIGRDLRTGDRVVIENQLETTDHSHLGQLVTYAAGTDAVNIIWVARELREEHRAALDWLNVRTDADTRFFGVEVSAVRIGTSLPAPLLRVVVQPNDWGKTVRSRAQTRQGGSSDKDLLYGEFWDLYLAALDDAGLTWTRARKGPSQNWFDAPGGVSGVRYTTSFNREGISSELYFGDPDPTVNQYRFEQLLRVRERLVADYGGDLGFEPLEGRKGCRISDVRSGQILDGRSAWPGYVDWLVDSQRRLRAAVSACGGVPAARGHA